jgi:hypothetical protein
MVIISSKEMVLFSVLLGDFFLATKVVILHRKMEKIVGIIPRKI